MKKSRGIIHLSANSAHKDGDTQLESVSTGRIKAGRGKVIRFSYTFPKGQNATDKYIIAFIDRDQLVAEVNETNNMIVICGSRDFT